MAAKRAKYSSNRNGDESLHNEDVQFDYSGNPTWKYKRSNLLGSEIVVIDSIQALEKEPSQLDYEIASQKAILMGPNTKFQISGGFEKLEAGNDKAWEDVPAAESTKVLLQPGWFDFLLKSVDVFHANTRISTSSENKFVSAHLQRFVDAYQDKEVLKLVAPQAAHPSRYLCSLEKDSLKVDSKEWQEYSKLIFKDKNITFDWYPRCWPFVQSVNHMYEDLPRALTMALIGKLCVRLTFVDDKTVIFRKVANNTTKYRFCFDKCKLIIEEARLSLPFEKSLFSTKRVLCFPGVTRSMQVENVPEGSSTCRVRFNETYIPSGIVIFALHKSVASGQYSFAKTTNTNVFADHQINSVEVSFNQSRFAVKDPSLGNVGEDIFESLHLLNHLKNPIFGVKPDIGKLSVDLFKDGAVASSFPHFYYPLTLFSGGGASRKVPSLDDGSCLGKRSDLDISVRFKEAGSTKDCVYCFVIYFEGTNLCFDTRNRLFFNTLGIIMG